VIKFVGTNVKEYGISFINKLLKIKNPKAHCQWVFLNLIDQLNIEHYLVSSNIAKNLLRLGRMMIFVRLFFPRPSRVELSARG